MESGEWLAFTVNIFWVTNLIDIFTIHKWRRDIKRVKEHWVPVLVITEQYALR